MSDHTSYRSYSLDVIDEDAFDAERDDCVLARIRISVSVSLDAPTRKVSRRAILAEVDNVIDELNDRVPTPPRSTGARSFIQLTERRS